MSEVIDPYKNLKDHLLALPEDTGVQLPDGTVIPVGKAAHFAVKLITDLYTALDASQKLLKKSCYPIEMRTRRSGD